MTPSLRLPLEKIAFGAAMAITVASGAWWWRQQAELRTLRAEPVAVPLRGEAYARSEFPVPARAPKAWGKPAAQSQGPGWVYEVFTPPVIYYHAQARAFSVTPPSVFQDGAVAFGLELLDVKRELYRLQLMGYLGAPQDYLATFVSPLVPETLLARPGRHFADLGLALRDFSVRKVNLAAPTEPPAYDIAAFAVLFDERTGEEVTLDNRQRKFTDTPLAVLRLGAQAKPREVREGDEFSDEAATYRIERIQLDPPEVVVAKQVPGLPYPELRVLKPATGTIATPASTPEKRFQRAERRGVAGPPNMPR